MPRREELQDEQWALIEPLNGKLPWLCSSRLYRHTHATVFLRPLLGIVSFGSESSEDLKTPLFAVAF